MKALGFDVYCPQRPTCDLSKLNVGDINNPDFDREPPPGGYPSDTEDVNQVIEVVDKLVDQDGKPVLLIAHSSGGWVVTQAAVPELQAKTRRAEGKPGGIIGIFYIGAFLVPVGESVSSFFQPKDGSLVTPSFMRFHVCISLYRSSIYQVLIDTRNTASPASEHPSTRPGTFSTIYRWKRRNHGLRL
jgi:pimeloyl-ACP methyl ester carboxylesterase